MQGRGPASCHAAAHHDWWICTPTSQALDICIPLQGINKAVDIMEATQAQVPIDRLIGVRAFSLDRVLEMEPAFLEVMSLCIWKRFAGAVCWYARSCDQLAARSLLHRAHAHLMSVAGCQPAGY